jgi:hypothetical protein
MYSPSGIGGTPLVRCRLLTGVYRNGPWPWRDEVTYRPGDETEFCGDSVAGAAASFERKQAEHGQKK